MARAAEAAEAQAISAQQAAQVASVQLDAARAELEAVCTHADEQQRAREVLQGACGWANMGMWLAVAYLERRGMFGLYSANELRQGINRG